MSTAVRRAPVALLTAVLVSGCAGVGGTTARPNDRPSPSSDPTPTAPSTETGIEPDPDTPTSWGPTEGEVAEAGELVAAMTLKQKVATVLMPGFWGYDGRAPEPTSGCTGWTRRRRPWGPTGSAGSSSAPR
jgi:beta-N-acetylhexosaminidase